MEDQPSQPAEPVKPAPEPVLTPSPTPNEPIVESNPVDNFTPPPPPPTTAIPDPPKVKKRSLKTLMIAIIAIATLGAAGAFAYFGVYVPNQPENVLKTALANLMAADSGQAKGEVDIDFGGYSFNPTFTLAAAADGGSSFSFGINAPSLQLSGEIKQTQGDVYFMFSGLEPVIETATDAAVDYGLDESTVDHLGEQLGLLEGTWSVVNDVVATDSILISDSDKQTVIDAFAERDVFIVSQEHDDEEIEGHSARHFTVSLNKEEFKTAINELNHEKLDQATKAEILSAIDEAELNDIEAWVYKDTKEFAQLRYQQTLDSQGADGNVVLTLTFLSFNQTETIVPPVEASDVKTWWENILNTIRNSEFIDPGLLNPSGFSLPLESIQEL